MARINYDISKTERDKQVYDIIVTLWKWVKPWTTHNFPMTDKEWGLLMNEHKAIINQLSVNKGVPEQMLITDMIAALWQYMQRRENESRRAPD